MIRRTISTLALWAVLFAAIYFAKGRGFSALIYILAVLSGYEACKILKKCAFEASFKMLFAATSVLFALIVFGNIGGNLYEKLGLIFWDVIFTILVFALWCLKDPFSGLIKNTVLPTACVFLLVSLPLSLYALMSFIFDDCGAYAGVIVACWALGVAKFSDIGGYLIGSQIGKRKLLPKVSPKKTWEGAIAGVVFSVAASYVILKLATPHFSGALAGANFDILTWVAAPIIGVVALMSDLLESVLKRKANVKDSGATIPGIGGALDLADSMLLTAPISLLFVSMLIFIF